MSRKRIFVGLLIIGVFLALWSFWWEPDRLIVGRHRMAVAGWPAEYGAVKIAVVSDIHAGAPYMNEAKLRRIVSLTNAEAPDLILLPGDFVITDVVGGKFMAPEMIAGILSGLQAPLGVYAVLGNHDWWSGGDRVKDALERAGIPVLDNHSLPLRFHGHPFQLAGIGDSFTGHDRLEVALHGIADSVPIIAFTHNPDLFAQMPSRVTVTFAGHTHGGQVNLPLLGRLIVPSKFGSRYAVGEVVEGGRHLFVTPGIGNSIIPVRFRVPPEISLVTLTPEIRRRADSAASDR